MHWEKLKHKLKNFSNIATSIAFIFGCIYGSAALVNTVVQLKQDDESHENSVQQNRNDISDLKTQVYFLKNCKSDK